MKRKEYFSFFLFCLLHWILYRKTWGLGDLRIHYVLNFCFLLFDFYPFLFFLLVLFLHPISLFDMFFIVPPLMCHHGIGFVERRGYGWRCLFCAFFSSSYGSHSNMPIWDRLSLSERYQDLGFCFFFFFYLSVVLIVSGFAKWRGHCCIKHGHQHESFLHFDIF